ncbi:MAG: hypothetical protein LKF52_02590 [Butyrivibrio sp.]|jgi:putative protease|nr:hypothetical protein [Butyrivibrio sp.]
MKTDRIRLYISIMNQEQLTALCESEIRPEAVYLDMNMVLPILQGDRLPEELERLRNDAVHLRIALPHVLRQEDALPSQADMELVIQKSTDDGFDGVLARNLEELAFLTESGYEGAVLLDYGVYIWNHGAESFILYDESGKKRFDAFSIPYELNVHEIRDLAKRKDPDVPAALCVYGRIPMMISASCLLKTSGKCSGKNGQNAVQKTQLEDRMSHLMPVSCICRYCYNVIWNHLPLSLHRQMDEIRKTDIANIFRMDFTTEDKKQTENVLTFWNEIIQKRQMGNPPYEDYTTGHFRRGVE